MQVDLYSERLGLPGMLPGVCESAELEGITEWVSLPENVLDSCG